jgi:sulfur-oxidizing protein SoxX
MGISSKKLAFRFLLGKLTLQEQILFKTIRNPNTNYINGKVIKLFRRRRMLNSSMKKLLTALALTSVVMTPVAANAADAAKTLTPVEQGKKLAFDRSKGNCLACHMTGDGAMPGNIGPALIAMKLRYPDKQKLFNKVWGTPETQTVPNSMMPPFGQHGILTDDEISKIVDYIYTL